MAKRATKRAGRLDARPALNFRLEPNEARALDGLCSALGGLGRSTVAKRLILWAAPRVASNPIEIFRKVTP